MSGVDLVERKGQEASAQGMMLMPTSQLPCSDDQEANMLSQKQDFAAERDGASQAPGEQQEAWAACLDGGREEVWIVSQLLQPAGDCLGQ